MENISIKVHPPWYARGTPIINTRDGPQMALSEKPLFAIRRGPSARGNPVEVRSLESAVGSQKTEVGRQKSEVGSRKPEDQSRGNPGGKTRLWLTLKTTFSNTQTRVYSQWYAQTRRVETILGDKISISNKPRRVDMILGDKISISNKPRRGNIIIENGMTYKPKTQRVDKIIAMAKIEKSQTRRVETIVENDMIYNPKTRRVEKIIDEKMEWYHPAGVSDANRLLCYNHNIPIGIKPKTRRVDKIIAMAKIEKSQTQRVVMIIENGMTFKPKTRRVDKIIDDKIIDEKSEWRKYHPAGVSDPYCLLCYNHNIPIGIKPKTQRVEMIIENDMTYNPKTRRVETIIENDMTFKPKTRRVETIVGENMHMQILHLTDDMIIHRMITKNTTPLGLSKNVSSACYNPAILAGIKTQTRRVEMIIENDMTYTPKTRMVDKIIAMAKIEKSQTRRVVIIVEIEMKHNPKTRRVETIIDEKMEWRKYHPAGVSFLHRNSYYNHNIPLGLKTKPTNGRINLIAI